VLSGGGQQCCAEIALGASKRAIHGVGEAIAIPGRMAAYVERDRDVGMTKVLNVLWMLSPRRVLWRTTYGAQVVKPDTWEPALFNVRKWRFIRFVRS